jgi:hypothetical protein
LPDGIFSYQTLNFWYTLEGLEMENYHIFMTIWSSLWSSMLFYCLSLHILTIFPILVYFRKKKLATLFGTWLIHLKDCRHIIRAHTYADLFNEKEVSTHVGTFQGCT